MSKKFVEQEIAKIKEMVAAGTTDVAHHVELNTHILQALVGGEITKTKKGDTKIKFTHAIPTTKQVAEIANLCDLYAQTVAGKLSVSTDDDMTIPVENITREIPTLEGKINNKILQNYVINAGGIINCMISGTDCITIAAYGEAARKDAIIKRTIIIGGCVLVIAGGITAGVIIHNKKKDGEDLEVVDLDATVEESVPEVTIDEEYESADVDASFAAAV